MVQERVLWGVADMIGILRRFSGRAAWAGALAVALGGMTLAPVAAQAQVRTVDPNTAIDADLAPVPQQGGTPTDPGVDPSVPSGNGAPYDPPPAGSGSTATGSTATGAPVTAKYPPANGPASSRARLCQYVWISGG